MEEDFDAITEVDDELVDEARTVKLKRESNHEICIVAACLVLVLGIGRLPLYGSVIFRKRFWWRQNDHGCDLPQSPCF